MILVWCLKNHHTSMGSYSGMVMPVPIWWFCAYGFYYILSQSFLQVSTGFDLALSSASIIGVDRQDWFYSFKLAHCEQNFCHLLILFLFENVHIPTLWIFSCIMKILEFLHSMILKDTDILHYPLLRCPIKHFFYFYTPMYWKVSGFLINLWKFSLNIVFLSGYIFV